MASYPPADIRTLLRLLSAGRHNEAVAVSRQSSPPGPDRAKDLALCQENFRRRLPTTLEDLHGPVTGVVELPMQGAFPVLAVRGRSAV